MILEIIYININYKKFQNRTYPPIRCLTIVFLEPAATHRISEFQTLVTSNYSNNSQIKVNTLLQPRRSAVIRSPVPYKYKKIVKVLFTKCLNLKRIRSKKLR